jgi:hypothetical protein
MQRSLQLLVGVACWWFLSAVGLADQRLVDLERSTVTVRVVAAGAAGALAGDVVVRAPLSDGSLDHAPTGSGEVSGAKTPHVQIVIDARQLRVVDAGRSAADRRDAQTRMLGPAVLDVKRFAWISFHSLESKRLDSRRWLVQGELELHGHIRPMAVTVVEEDGRYKGSATVKQSDFGIAPISIAGGAVKVKDEVRVDFDIVMR